MRSYFSITKQTNKKTKIKAKETHWVATFRAQIEFRNTKNYLSTWILKTGEKAIIMISSAKLYVKRKGVRCKEQRDKMIKGRIVDKVVANRERKGGEDGRENVRKKCIFDIHETNEK